MPVTLQPPIADASHVPPRHKRWTREEVEILKRTGIAELDKYELIEGELVQKMGKNLPHMRALVKLLKALHKAFNEDRIVPEASTLVPPGDPGSEPEPDIIVLDQSIDTLTSKPHPRDIVLLIEISDTTLAFDLRDKAALYARAGIADYWVLDLNSRRMLVHRDPRGGEYATILAYDETESVSPLAATDSSILVSELL